MKQPNEELVQALMIQIFWWLRTAALNLRLEWGGSWDVGVEWMPIYPLELGGIRIEVENCDGEIFPWFKFENVSVTTCDYGKRLFSRASVTPEMDDAEFAAWFLRVIAEIRKQEKLGR